MKCIYIVTALLIISFIILLQARKEGMANLCTIEKGTLVIAVPSKEGLVVCADKRVYFITENTTKDEKIKIIQLGNYGLFASIGNLTFTRTVNFDSESIDVDRIVKNYFNTKDIRIFKDKQWNDFRQHLENFFKADSYDLTQYGNIEKPFLQVAFFYLDLKKSIKRTVVQLFLKKEAGNPLSRPRVEISFKTDSEYIIKNSIKLLGEAAVINEIKNGTDSRFDDIRSNPLIQKAFNSQAIPLGQFTSKEARDFASYLIEITSNRSKLIPNFNGHVSQTCDCALLDFESGFKWIDK